MDTSIVIDWTQVIITFITCGALTSIALIPGKREKLASENTKIALENMGSVCEELRKIITAKDADIAMYKEEIASYLNKYDQAHATIDTLYREKSDMQTQLDTKNTECAVSEILKCECVSCSNRKPPLGAIDSIPVLTATESI